MQDKPLHLFICLEKLGHTLLCLCSCFPSAFLPNILRDKNFLASTLTSDHFHFNFHPPPPHLFLCGHREVIHSRNIRRVSLPIHNRPLSNIFSHSLQLSHSQMLVKRAKGLMDSKNTEVLCAQTHTQPASGHPLFFRLTLASLFRTLTM